jgi:hypothetical protein
VTRRRQRDVACGTAAARQTSAPHTTESTACGAHSHTHQAYTRRVLYSCRRADLFTVWSSGSAVSQFAVTSHRRTLPAQAPVRVWYNVNEAIKHVPKSKTITCPEAKRCKKAAEDQLAWSTTLEVPQPQLRVTPGISARQFCDSLSGSCTSNPPAATGGVAGLRGAGASKVASWQA